MRKLIRTVRPFLVTALLPLLVFGLGFALIGGLALGLGYLLSRILPFSLFEATLLSTLLAFATIYVIFTLGRPADSSVSSPRFGMAPDDDGLEGEYTTIPKSRFYATERERTWEAWLRSEIANDMYVAFQDEPHAVNHLNETQSQELAIRLSDVALSIIKRKKSSRGRLTITISALRRELSRMGQQPYDDRILRLALDAINMNLDFVALALIDVVRTQAWHERANVPDEY